MDPNFTHLLGRIRTDRVYSGYLRELGTGLADASTHLEAVRAKVSTDAGLNELGKRNRVADAVTRDLMPRLAAGTLKIRKAKERRDSERLALRATDPTDPADAVGELRRQEMRTYLRNLPEARRVGMAIEITKDPALAPAILDAPAYMSGLSDDLYGKIRDTVVEKRHGKRLAEIQEIQDDFSNLGGLADIVTSQLRAASGLKPEAFTERLRELEDKIEKGSGDNA